MSNNSRGRDETSIAYCSVSGESSQFDQHFRPFFNHFATMKFFYKIKFTDASSAGKTATKKSQKYFELPAFNWNLNHSNL